MKLNLASGNMKHEDFISVDKVKLENVDRVVDLENYPWPWKSGAIEEIFCRYYVEQTSNLVKFVDECYRILKPEGKLIIVSPYYTSNSAWRDPFTIRGISESLFAFFNKKAREENGFGHYEIESDFDMTCSYSINGTWQNRSEEARVFAVTHYVNVITDVQIVLIKRGEKKK